MKKLLSLIMTTLLILSAVPAMAEVNYDKAAARIAPLELIDVNTPDKLLTRGEGIIALMKMYIRAEMSYSGEASVFSDVASDTVLKAYANYAYNLGFVNGYGDGSLRPDEVMTLEQLSKIAVCVLGKGFAAEKAGGYPNGYVAEATRAGLFKGMPASDSGVTHKQAVIIFNNMLDQYPIETVFGTDELAYQTETLYDQMMNLGDYYSVTGIVDAVGKCTIMGAEELEKEEISVHGFKLLYNGKNREDLLGRKVTIRYRHSDTDGVPVVISVYKEIINKELTIPAKYLSRINENECVEYNDDERYTKVYSVSGASVIYNGRSIAPSALVTPLSGSVTLVDNNGGGNYDVVLVEEFASLTVKKVLSSINSIYFEDDTNFRGKNGIRFDFEDEEKEYSLVMDGEEIEFSAIKEGDTVSIWADMNEEKVKLQLCTKVVTGKIEEMEDDAVTINGQHYMIYAPNLSRFTSTYKLGDTGTFSINHVDEIVGIVGKIQSDANYGYVLNFISGNGFTKTQVKLLTPGSKEKVVKEKGGEETISYVYTNGEQIALSFEDKVTLIHADGTKEKITSSSLTERRMERAIIGYELSADGKIKSLSINSVPAIADEYSLNGDLNSYGGFTDKTAFYVDAETSVICITTKDNPTEDDYAVDVTTVENSKYMIVPVNIDQETQIAECAVIIADMDAEILENFDDSDDVSVIGKLRVKVEDGTEYSMMEVLTGEKVALMHTSFDTTVGEIAKTLSKGDLIRVDAKDDGEIRNIQKIASLSTLGRTYFIDKPEQRGETAFGQVKSIVTDRLDNFRNERVDEITIDINGTEKRYVVLRKDGPLIYTYNRETNIISPAIPEEILASEDVGDGASDLYVIANENVPIVLVNVVD